MLIGLPSDERIIDIVVPVHNNIGDANCLFESLRSARNKTPAHLIVIDDASTDDRLLCVPQTGGSIHAVTFLRNERNQGFAASVNRALRMSRRDVVLLNSDTLVHDGWLDRMCRAGASNAAIGTITPFSNAATIFSYPFFPHDYCGVLEADWRQIDQFCADVDAPPVVTPTGVGFCMLVKRQCLDAVGWLDDVTFREGYGEESDFCRRAVAAGWLNVAAPNVFVWHRGSGSFADRATDLRLNAEKILRRRYPDYSSAVAKFIRNDPLEACRREIDIRRLTADPRRLRLLLGTSQEFTSTIDTKAMSFGLVRGRRVWRPTVEGFGPLPNLQAFSDLARLRVIREFLVRTKVTELIVPKEALPIWLIAKFRRAARSLSLNVVDFASVCSVYGA